MKLNQKQKNELIKLCTEYYEEDDAEPSNLCDAIIRVINNED